MLKTDVTKVKSRRPQKLLIFLIVYTNIVTLVFQDKYSSGKCHIHEETGCSVVRKDTSKRQEHRWKGNIRIEHSYY